ncbi:zincin [Zalerion maritima]|uniref:Zincin n=1 Tax=Zalerion maritima TaxID=339359 RepID=A0AAD5RN12_9PEZI|nr:zincin [Zalerion maritima]
MTSLGLDCFWGSALKIEVDVSQDKRVEEGFDIMKACLAENLEVGTMLGTPYQIARFLDRFAADEERAGFHCVIIILELEKMAGGALEYGGCLDVATSIKRDGHDMLFDRLQKKRIRKLPYHSFRRSSILAFRTRAKLKMKPTTILSVLGLVVGAAASPITTLSTRGDSTTNGTTAYEETTFPIHPSCNITLHRQLSRALEETVDLATVARDHLLRHGNESSFFQRHFGNTSTSTPIGWYQRVISADRGEMLFRCDDPDENCATQEGWAGHWRGANATQETVICPLSFSSRLYLSSVCGLGYSVANSALNTYWATDLLHRVFHVPQISEGVVSHYAEDYAEVLELARTEPEKSVIDSEALQYFAIDVYAFDVAAPGVGCSGELEDE